MADKVVPIAPAKIAQIREAGRKALSPGEFERLNELLSQLSIYGLTPYINRELGSLMSKFGWELEISESPEWAEALIACDVAFLGSELKEMCRENGISDYGHKKELCRRLYHAKVPEVVAVMEPILEKGEGAGKESGGERHGLSEDRLRRIREIAAKNDIAEEDIKRFIEACEEGDLLALERYSDEYPELSRIASDIIVESEREAKDPYLEKYRKSGR